MNIFVISLNRSKHRQVNIAKQMSILGLDYEVFSAIDGRKEKHELFSKYNKNKRLYSRGDQLTAGQLGCYASHYLMWQKCIELNHPIFILEDDCLIDSTPFMDFYAFQHDLPKKYELIRLFKHKRKNYTAHFDARYKSIEIALFNKGHMSATGYYLTPAGAQKLLAQSQEWHLAVDIYMDQFWINNVTSYGTIPPCLTNDPQFDSEIGYAKKPKRTLKTKITREWYNLKNNFLRLLFLAKLKK